MRKLVALLSFVLLASFLGASPASATAGPNTEGYVWHVTASKIMRYNAVENVDEPISTADASCASTPTNNVNDLQVDEVHGYLYWIQSDPTPFVARMKLSTGVCQLVSSTAEVRMLNGRWPTWRGLSLDIAHQLLFFTDNQGHPFGSANPNTTIHWINLAALPATGDMPADSDVVMPVTPGLVTEPGINTSNDIELDGDYAYITGSNTDDVVNGLADRGVAVFKVQVLDSSTHLPLTSTSSYKFFSYIDANDPMPYIIHTEIHNGRMYWSTYDWQVGGIKWIDMSGWSQGSPITQVNTLVTNDNTYDISWGFAFGQNDVIFDTDSPGWPAPWDPKMIWLDGSANAPTVNAGTTLDDVSMDTTWYAQVDWNLTAGPSKPVISTPVRTSDTAGSFNYVVPADAAPSTQYPFTLVGSDNSVITGVCSSSPCGLTGLVAGVTYSVTMRQAWMNGSTEIIHSLASAAVTIPLPTVVPPPVPANAASPVNGFSGNSTVLSAGIKNSIKTFVNAHPNANVANCVGYVSKNMSASTVLLNKIGLVRAKAACAYVHSVDPSISVGSLKSVVTTASFANSHQVVISLARVYRKAITGFVTFESSLAQDAKDSIDRFVSAHPQATRVACTGYVGHNWKGVSKAKLKALGLARAKAACAYVYAQNPSLVVTKTSVVVTDLKLSAIRKVVVELNK